MQKISRRSFVCTLTAALTPVTTFAKSAPRKRSKALTRDEWLARWQDSSTARDIDGALFLGRFLDPMYYLLKPISWKAGANQAIGSSAVEVPVGFVTDLASIPPIFYSILRPDGNYAFAAIVHDYLYWAQALERDVADRIFKFSMQELGVGTFTTNILYRAVRIAGQAAWNENAKLKSQGEKRILKTFPDKPTILWNDWKMQPGAFES